MSDLRSLEALGLRADPPTAAPLTYPGAAPRISGLLLAPRFLEVDPRPGRAVGDWEIGADGAATLDEMLRNASVAPMAGRHPVLAVGSNASPAQLMRKFGRRAVSAVVPMLYCQAAGIASGISAHIGRYGYVPAAPIEVPGETSTLVALWLDEAQLTALDETEPNYRRVDLTAEFTVSSQVGEPVRPCSVYVGRWGCLGDPDGTPWRLIPQRQLIERLLTRISDLRELFGNTPESFVELAADRSRREHAMRLLKRSGLIAPQLRLEKIDNSVD